MKRIAAISAILPVPALAHGIHAPLPDHALAHLGPVAGLAVILVAGLVAWRRARG